MAAILFTRTDRLLSRFIRRWINSDISHSAICFYDETLQIEMVLDVAFSGYRLIPISLFQEQNCIVDRIELNHDILPGIKAVARYLGKPYDWRAFVGFSKLFKKVIENPTDNPKALICTELVVHALRISGYPDSHLLKYKNTTPKELREFLQK